MCVWKLCTPKSIDSESLSPLIGHVYLYKGYIPCPGTPICARVRKWYVAYCHPKIWSPWLYNPPSLTMSHMLRLTHLLVLSHDFLKLYIYMCIYIYIHICVSMCVCDVYIYIYDVHTYMMCIYIYVCAHVYVTINISIGPLVYTSERCW